MQIALELLVPLFLYFEWDFGETITWQVYQANLIGDAEEIDELCSARSTRGPRQFTVTGERINRTRLSRIASPGKGYLATKVCRRIAQGARRL